MTRVVGPHADAAGKYWIIDGRDEEVPAGTAARNGGEFDGWLEEKFCTSKLDKD